MLWDSLNKYPEVKLLGPSLSLVITFVLKSILPGISTAISALCCCFYFHEISFSIPLLSVCVSFSLKWVSCTQHMWGSCFVIHSATVSLFIGAFNPFAFKVIVDRYVLIGILLFIFYIIFLLLKEGPLTFCVMLVRWWWTPLVFSCLGRSLSVRQS